jgi:predicted nucleic acid-binding protein
MIVVADASPLNYLIQIECDALLPKLFGKVLVPAGVIKEFRHPATPPSVASWLSRMPSWVEVRVASTAIDPTLDVLDPGEREAIQLAQEVRADLLLIDERRGRLEAKRRAIPTTGTLGVLLAAQKQGMIDAEAALERLINETSFRITPAVRETFVQQYRESRKRKA